MEDFRFFAKGALGDIKSRDLQKTTVLAGLFVSFPAAAAVQIVEVC